MVVVVVGKVLTQVQQGLHKQEQAARVIQEEQPQLLDTLIVEVEEVELVRQVLLIMHRLQVT